MPQFALSGHPRCGYSKVRGNASVSRSVGVAGRSPREGVRRRGRSRPRCRPAPRRSRRSLAWRERSAGARLSSIPSLSHLWVGPAVQEWPGVRGLVFGPIWPCLASFTPSGEAENEAGVASFGPPLTRKHEAAVALWWPWLVSSGVRRSGKTFNPYHFRSFPIIPLVARWQWGRDARFPPSRERRGIRVNDACNHRRERKGYGAMGSCRWFWGTGLHPHPCILTWKAGQTVSSWVMQDRGLAWSPRLSHHRARTVAWATEPVSARTGPRRTHVY